MPLLAVQHRRVSAVSGLLDADVLEPVEENGVRNLLAVVLNQLGRKGGGQAVRDDDELLVLNVGVHEALEAVHYVLQQVAIVALLRVCHEVVQIRAEHLVELAVQVVYEVQVLQRVHVEVQEQQHGPAAAVRGVDESGVVLVVLLGEHLLDIPQVLLVLRGLLARPRVLVAERVGVVVQKALVKLSRQHRRHEFDVLLVERVKQLTVVDSRKFRGKRVEKLVRDQARLRLQLNKKLLRFNDLLNCRLRLHRKHVIRL